VIEKISSDNAQIQVWELKDNQILVRLSDFQMIKKCEFKDYVLMALESVLLRSMPR